MNYSDEELYEYVTAGRLRKYVPLMIYLDDSDKDVEIPLIKNYEVFKIDNHTVRIKLHPRSAFVSVCTMGEYLILDEEGYVITTSNGRLVGIPVINGLDFNSFNIGEKIPGDERNLRKIYEITGLSYEYDVELNEITLEANGHITLKCGNILVYCGRMTDFNTVFDVVLKAKERTKDGEWYIDFTGTIDQNSTIQARPISH
ncbi:MAG: hypothetical protein MJ113_06700 [Lachnospiraceae bacterium]|nr:hypothetical protein [Lachnospiraceae bacterium]